MVVVQSSPSIEEAKANCPRSAWLQRDRSSEEDEMFELQQGKWLSRLSPVQSGVLRGTLDFRLSFQCPKVRRCGWRDLRLGQREKEGEGRWISSEQVEQ
jgi:hypothetical protein